MKVYHIAYEPTWKSVDIHFWTSCNLSCRACYANFEHLDFGLLDDPIAAIASKSRQRPPDNFLSLSEVLSLLKGLPIERAIFMGTEASLDPELPALAKLLHREFHCYNVLLSNGLKLTDNADIDEVIFGIKAFSGRLHYEYTGVSNKRILDNFASLYGSGKKLQAETVLIPNFIDGGEIERVAAFIGTVSRNIPLRVDAYFPVSGNPWRPAEKDEVNKAADLARKHLANVSCLTLDLKRTGDKSVRVF